MRAIIIATACLMWRVYETQNLMANQFAGQQKEIAALQGEVVYMKGQMVGWDVLKRMETTLSLLAEKGKGNEALAAFSATMRLEREARNDK